MISASLACVMTLALTDGGNWLQSPASAQQETGPRLLQPQTSPPATSPTVPRVPERPDSSVPRSPLRPDSELTPDERVNVEVYEKTNRSVVNISTLTVRPEGFFFMPVPSEGNGSGSVLDNSGHILTNNHVISDARQIVVTLFNGESYPARRIGADPVNDIAILKIDAPPEQLFPISLGDSDGLQVGMRVFALGNPFGLDRTMSTGIISSLNRSLEVQENWVIKSIIQIDASINPGSSGGPLLDSQGRLIGMNTAIATGDSRFLRQSAGIGFSIPVNLIRRVIPDLIQHGRVIRGDIGIIQVSETDDGLRIVELEPGGAAERAGLRGPKITRQRQGPFVMERMDRSAADVITAVNGNPVHTVTEFTSQIERKKPGDVVELTILREGRTMTVSVTLGGDRPVPQRIAPGDRSV
jgi:S1-C subfamily serine protease